MKYIDGKIAMIGDHVLLGNGWTGVVVCDIDSSVGTIEFPIEEWRYLKKGIMVRSEQAGLIYFAEPDVDLELADRSADEPDPKDLKQPS
jgi:hypothetical protein